MGWGINVYLQANALICALWVLIIIGRKYLNTSQLLKLSYVGIALGFVFIVSSQWLGEQNFATPSAQLWAGESVWATPTQAMKQPHQGVITVGKYQQPVNYLKLHWVFLSLIGSILALTLFRFGRSFWFFHTLTRRAIAYRKIGRVRLYFTEQFPIPFSFHTVRSAVVMLPTSLLERPGSLQMAIRHEIQHHRQRDTLWAYAIETIRCFFFLNPFAHGLSREISDLQEFACDEVLVDQKNVPPHAYGSCLIEVASQIGARFQPVGATAMAASSEQLKRRIQAMKQPKKTNSLWLATTILILTLGLAAFASAGSVKDRRISMQEAQKWVSNMRSEVPINLNEAVLHELNRFLGTADGRKWVRDTLDRMQGLAPILHEKFKKYKAPKELLAVGFIESGYKNLPEHMNPMQSAGVWQFIPTTARRFNLRVDNQVDERMDIDKATDAALRYLHSNFYLLEDWRLAVMGYYAGENRIRAGIQELGTSDPWVLIAHGYQGDSRYLAKFMAAAIILENPESLN